MVVFKTICFGLLIFLVGIEFQKYFENNDVSSTYYKKFENHKEDVYPTFSFCIVSYNGRLFQGALGNLTKEYWRYTRGKIRIDGNPNANQLSQVEFDDAVIDLNSVFLRYRRKSKGFEGVFQEETFSEFSRTLKISHQDPNRICFTRTGNAEEGRLFKYDLMELNPYWLHANYSEGHAYIHQKGQLIRTLKKPTFKLFGKQLHSGKLNKHKGFQYGIKLRNNAIDVLRKRPNAAVRCDDTLHDDDNQWRQTVIEKTQCIPTFMRRFVLESDARTYLLRLQECNQTQYRAIEERYDPYDKFEAIAKYYTGPCTQMSSIVTITETLKHFVDSNHTSLKLNFQYDECYKETVNQKAYLVSDLLCQIGGIVGMIIGYSLLHLPETFEDSILKLVQYCKQQYIEKYSSKVVIPSS